MVILHATCLVFKKQLLTWVSPTPAGFYPLKNKKSQADQNGRPWLKGAHVGNFLEYKYIDTSTTKLSDC